MSRAREDQAVVAVVLEVAAPGAEERVLEGLPHLVGLELVLAGVGQAEVVDPERLPLAWRDSVWALVGYLHAHVLEQGQQVGQSQGRSGAEDLRAQRVRRGLERPVEADRQVVVLGEELDVPDVGKGRARHPVGAVGGGEGLAPLAQHGVAALLTVLVDQGALQVVGPRPRGRHEAQLDLPRVVLGQASGLGVDQEVESHDSGLG